MTGLFLILTVRFIQLQLLERARYFRESERNRVRDIVVEPPRGLIFDRHGEILVDNRPAYSVSVIPYEFLQADSSVRLLGRILGEQPEALIGKVKKNKVGSFTPLKIRHQADFAILSNIEENRLDLPGVYYGVESKRFYPAGLNAPHLFGYLGEITATELAAEPKSTYRMGDVIGKSGIELQYEDYLRGKPGIKYVEVDVLGREVRDLVEFPHRDAVRGMNISLTIDAEIQRFVEHAMNDLRGAAVVLDPRNGEVIAMLSKPDYDPELFAKPLTSDIWASLLNNPGKPLYNRASQSLYPPGSTYKLVLAVAGLETGRIDVATKVYCGGAFLFGRRYFNCWKSGGHGEVDFYQAIERSCNVYFFTMGLKTGLGNWTEYSRRFNFGAATEIDLPNEATGLVPSKTYLDRKYGEKGWTDGLLLNLAVGQGDLLVTPLQLAYFAMILGNEGVAYRPHLIRQIQTSDSSSVFLAAIDSLVVTGVAKQTYARIKHGMYLVVNGEQGTAKTVRRGDVKVCGKTGTAQNPHGDSHAWFIGFAPMQNPEIVVTVLVENGGSGGAVAGPVARGIFEAYFGNKTYAARMK
jgi:penicillin-binding protein 2